MEAVILAGGFGTRLAEVVKDVPKPMAPVAGRPFLEYILDELLRQGVNRTVLAVGYKKEAIINHFRQEYRGMQLLYSVEAMPLFTGGAIRQALSLCREERVFVINGDTYFQTNLTNMRNYSEKRLGHAVMAVKELRNFSRYGAVEFDTDGLAMAITEKAFCTHGYINGGVYDLPRQMLETYPERFSLENDCFPQILEKKVLSCYVSEGEFIDIGIPEDYYRAQTLFGGDGFA